MVIERNGDAWDLFCFKLVIMEILWGTCLSTVGAYFFYGMVIAKFLFGF